MHGGGGGKLGQGVGALKRGWAGTPLQNKATKSLWEDILVLIPEDLRFPRNSKCSFNQPWNDERPSGSWNHMVILNAGLGIQNPNY